MSPARIITFRTAPETAEELDSLAQAMERDRSYLLNEAVRSYLSRQRRFKEMVEEGLRASERGDLIDDEQVDAEIESWLRNPKSREKATGKKPAEARKARARA